MGGSGFAIAFKPLPRKKQCPPDELVTRFAQSIHEGVRTATRRKRELILAGLREESDSWTVLNDKLFVGFSDECSPIVKHVAAMALIRERENLARYLFAPLGYQLVPQGSSAIASVLPLRAAAWGTTGEPGSRVLGGPFVPTDDRDALGWSEVELAPADSAASYAARTGLCACELCGRLWTGTVLSPSVPRRSGRDAAIARAHQRLDALGAARSRAVMRELDAWSWTGKELPPSFTKLLGELGRPALTPLELAAMLAVRARAHLPSS